MAFVGLCSFVCVLNVFVCSVCELLCNVVWFVAFRVFSKNELVRWDAPLKNLKTKEMCRVGTQGRFGSEVRVQVSEGAFWGGIFQEGACVFLLGRPRGTWFSFQEASSQKRFCSVGCTSSSSSSSSTSLS